MDLRTHRRNRLRLQGHRTAWRAFLRPRYRAVRFDERSGSFVPVSSYKDPVREFTAQLADAEAIFRPLVK